MESYDFVVIGSGVGLNVLSQAINKGLKCALIEQDKIGGTCLTRGCIPSKVLVYPADIIREAQKAEDVGVKFTIERVNWDKIAERMWSQINESKEMEKGLSQVPNVDLYKGRGEFIDKYTMEIFNKNNESIGKLKGDTFLLASGARPLIPPIEGLEDAGYITTKTFFGEKFPEKPWKSLIIIGGGIIAAEFAHIFSSLRTEVTIVEMLPRLVSTEEPEISKILEDNFREVMNVHVNKRAIKAKSKRSHKTVLLEDVNTGEKMEVKAEEIFVAAGRRSNADLLKVENTGIDTDDKGWIKTNQFLETNVENIWCIGDANGKYQFRHKGNYESELVAYNIFGNSEQKRKVDYSSVPWAVFTYPQIGHVGMTQKEAMESGHQILVAKNKYSSVAKGFAMGLSEEDPDNGLVKLVIDESYKILGANIIGPSAATLIQQFVYLMNSGYRCEIPETAPPDVIPKEQRACPEAGSFMPIYNSMVIHPSLNEVAAWALGNLRPVNIKHEHHHHEE